MDKNDLPLSSDSLIQIAVGYYSNGKDRLKKGKASFYLGRVKSSRGMLEDAQKYFLEALSILDVTNGLLAPQNAHRYNLPKTKKITIRSRYKMISSVFKYNPK